MPLQPIVNLFAGLRRFLWLAIAQRFADAGKVYEANPMAVHLCGMNMIYEVMKNGGDVYKRQIYSGASGPYYAGAGGQSTYISNNTENSNHFNQFNDQHSWYHHQSNDCLLYTSIEILTRNRC